MCGTCLAGYVASYEYFFCLLIYGVVHFFLPGGVLELEMQKQKDQ